MKDPRNIYIISEQLNMVLGASSFNNILAALINEYICCNPFQKSDILGMDGDIFATVKVIKTSPCFCQVLGFDGYVFRRKVRFDEFGHHIIAIANVKLRKLKHDKMISQHFLNLVSCNSTTLLALC